MVIAYLRVSTEKQFLENQKEEILRFTEKKNITVDKWCTETVSGKVATQNRKISHVFKKMKRGDILIVTEISRLSRTLLEIMNILNLCIQKEVILYSTKEGYIFQDDINSKVLGFAFGLVAEIERNLISIRTKEALARRKKEGMTLDRQKGFMPKTALLREHRLYIEKQLKKGASSRIIARQMGVSSSTVQRFINNELKKE